MSRRTEARRRREAEILSAAAAILADRGFHQTRLEDVGSAVGISGPALYRYFSGKEELLAQILIDISIRLVDGARAVLDRAKSNDWGPEETLRGLLAHHVYFAVTEPEQSAKVRSLQRLYMVLWVDALRELQPELTSDEAQLKVQLTAGLINSSRHVLKWAGSEATRENAFEMALAALGINNQ